MGEPSELGYVRATPWRRDPIELASRLRDWALSEISPTAELKVLAAPENGNAADTVLFDLQVDDQIERLVAKMAPLPSAVSVFQDVHIAMQARVMRLIAARTAVPVPTVKGVWLDESFLGVPFLVMTRSPGREPRDDPPYVFGGWVVDMTPEERAEMQRNTVRLLVQIHELTPETTDLSFVPQPAAGADTLDQHLADQRSYYAWVCDELRIPLVERMLDWLTANRPAVPGPTVLNWGDARIGNILWDGPTPAAVLDWDMATLGPGEIDLGWTISQHHFFQSMARSAGVPGLPDFMRRDDVCAAYTELSGRPVEHLDWFEVFAGLRLASISARTRLRHIAYGHATMPEDPDDLVAFRPLLESMLAGTYWDPSE
jgi:aminoglycoside phosphotransferase (APT) family kinase protein